MLIGFEDSPNWKVEFRVHTYASLLIVGAKLFQNLVGKNDDQVVVYASRLLNKVKYNYSTIEKEALGISIACILVSCNFSSFVIMLIKTLTEVLFLSL